MAQTSSLCQFQPEAHQLVCSDLDPSGCTALTYQYTGLSCDDFCSNNGLQCVGAWEEAANDCVQTQTWTCDQVSSLQTAADWSPTGSI